MEITAAMSGAAMAGVATTAVAEEMVLGPYGTAMLVDSEGLDYLLNQREGDTDESVFEAVAPTLKVLLPSLRDHGFPHTSVRLDALVDKAGVNELEKDYLFRTFGEVLAFFGKEHPDEYRSAVQELGIRHLDRMKVGLDGASPAQLRQFLSLVNWKVERERKKFAAEGPAWFLENRREKYAGERRALSGATLFGAAFGGFFVAFHGGLVSSNPLGSLVAISIVGGAGALLFYNGANRGMAAERVDKQRYERATRDETLQPIVIDPDVDLVAAANGDFKNQLYAKLKLWLPSEVLR